MEVPLMQLGPSQTYGTAYYARPSSAGVKIIAVDGGSLSDSPPPINHDVPRTLLDRLFQIERVYFSIAAAATFALSMTKFATPKKKFHSPTWKLANLVTHINGSVHPVKYKLNQLALFTRLTAKLREQQHESHSKTNRGLRTNKTVPNQEWVFTHYAGTCRRPWREQGNSIRASRSIGQERRVKPRSEQSALFIDC